MKRTALIGWNAKRNVGDDAMTVAFLELLKGHTKTIILVCDKNLESLKFIRSYPEFTFKFVPLHDYFAHIRGIKGLYYRYFLPLYLLLVSDEIIIGGGTLFHTSGILKFYNNIASLNFFLKSRVKIIASCVSIGPFRDEKAPHLFRRFADKIDHISVRDERSYKLAYEIAPNKTTFYPDVALSVPQFLNIDNQQENKVSIVLRQGYLNEKEVIWLDRALSQIHRLYSETIFEFITFSDLNISTENDELAINKFISHSFGEWKENIRVVGYDSRPEKFYKLLASSKFNLCVRLHGSVMSYATETNFLTLSYHKKCEDFFNLMNLDPKFLIKDYDNYELLDSVIHELMNDKIIVSTSAELNIEKSTHHLDYLNQYNDI